MMNYLQATCSPPAQVFIYNSKQRVAERVAVGDMTNWHTLMVQMHLLGQRSGDYIQDVKGEEMYDIDEMIFLSIFRMI